jgi:hypothetical protein
MSIDVWGLVPKAQDDAQKIDEAISAAITAHEEDPDAHLGAGEALDSHRASEIIDHLAESIVTDKIAEGAITPDKMSGTYWPSKDVINSDFREVIPQFDFDQYWRVFAAGFGSNLFGLRLYSSTVLNNKAGITPAWTFNDYTVFNYNPSFLMRLATFCNGTYELYFGIGDCTAQYDGDFAGFKIVNGTLYAYMYTFSGNHTQSEEVAGITVTNYNDYEIRYTTGSKVEFYVNTVLVSTFTLYMHGSVYGTPVCLQAKTTQTGKYAGATLKRVLTSADAAIIS